MDHTSQFETGLENLQAKAQAARSSRISNGENVNEDAVRAQLLARTGEKLFAATKVPTRQARRTELHGSEWLIALDRLRERLKTGFLAALIGDRGPGKTQMAVELIRGACHGGSMSIYTTAMEFFLAIKESYHEAAADSETEVIKTFATPSLLVIDEVQERGETAWEDRLLTHLMDVRYRNEKDTLLISNLKRQPFLDSLGPSITSRLIETGGIIECTWPSFRL